MTPRNPPIQDMIFKAIDSDSRTQEIADALSHDSVTFDWSFHRHFSPNIAVSPLLSR